MRQVKNWVKEILRPVEAGYLSKRVDNCVFRGPWKFRRIICWTVLDVIWSVLENEVPIGLEYQPHQPHDHSFDYKAWYLREAIPVKNESMQ